MKESVFNKYYLLILNVLPRKFEDFTPKQFIRTAAILFNEEYCNRSKLLRILAQLLAPRCKYLRLHMAIAFMDEEQIEELGSLLSFVFDPLAATEKNLIPSFTFRRKKYYGPYQDLSNIDWGEFRNTSDYCTLYSRSKEAANLEQAIALLYRQKNEVNDNNSFLARTKIFAKLPHSLKMAVYLNFILLLNAVAPLYPHVFCKVSKRSKKPGLWYSFMGEWMGWKPEEYAKKDNLPMHVVLSSLEELFKKSKKK